MEPLTISASSERSPEISLRNFLYVIFKRKWQIFRFFLGTVIVITVFSLVWPPTYRAQATVLVKFGRENIYVPTLPKVTPISDPVHQDQVNSEVEILKSGYLARKVVESIGPFVIYPGLNDSLLHSLRSLFSNTQPTLEESIQKAASKLQIHLQVAGGRDLDTIGVSFDHRDPKMAARVVNTLVNFYLERHLDIHKNPEPYVFYRDQSVALKEKLERSQANLEAFMRQHVISSPDEERSLLLKQQADVRAELNKTLSQEAETESRLAQLRRQLAGIPKTILMDQQITQSPEVAATLQAHLMDLKVKERELLTKYSDQNYLVKSAQSQIQMLRSKLAEEDRKRYTNSRTGPNPLYQDLTAQITHGEADLQATRAKSAVLSAQSDRYRDRLEKLNQAQAQFDNLKQQVEIHRQDYQLYLAKLEETRISNALDSAVVTNVSIIDMAVPPLLPIFPLLMLNIAISLVLGIIGGLGWAFFKEHMNSSLEKSEDVESYLQLPVLASIPNFR